MQDSRTFQTYGLWINFGVIPVANTLSGTFRLISSVALAAFNLLKVLALPLIGLTEWMFSIESDRMAEIKDSIQAVFYNVISAFGGLLEAIPIIGNIPYWILAGKFGVTFDMKFMG